MHRLRLTDGGNYVIWENKAGKPAVVWAFKDTEVAVAQPFIAKAGQVYIIGDDGNPELVTI